MQSNLHQTDSKLEILVFKTDMKTREKVRQVSPILDRLLAIAVWSVDNQAEPQRSYR